MATTDPTVTNSNTTPIITDSAPIVTATPEATIRADGNSAVINRSALLAGTSDPDGDPLSIQVDPATLPAGVTYNHVDGSTVTVTTTTYYGFNQTITIPAVDTLTLDTSAADYSALAQGEVQDITVRYAVSDGTLSTPAQAVFHVVGVNDAPIVSGPLSAQVTEGDAPVTVDALAQAHDADHGAVLSVVAPPPPPMPFDVATLPAGVTFDAATHSFSIDPSNPAYAALAAGQLQTVTVNYGVSDGTLVVAQSVSFTIVGVAGGVVGAAEAPVFSGPGTFSVQEDFGVESVAPTDHQGEVEVEVEAPEIEIEIELNDLAEGRTVTIPNSINLLGNATDANKDVLSVVNLPAELPAGIRYVHVDPITTTNGYYGATTTTAGVDALVIDPTDAAFQALARGEVTTITINYGVTDGTSVTPAQAVFTITGTNDAPMVSGAVLAAATEDGAIVTADALANASDVDHGAVLSVTATPVIAAPDTYWDGASEVEAELHDAVDGFPNHVSYDISALPSFITYHAASHSFTLDPRDASLQHLSAGETMTVSVNYGVTDGIAAAASFATVTFVVTGTNDAPVVSGPGTFSVHEDFGVQSVAPTSGVVEVEVEAPELELHDLVDDSSGVRIIPNSINLLANASDPDHLDVLSVTGLPAELPAGIRYVHLDPVTTTNGYYGATSTTPGIDALVIDPTSAAFQSLAQGEVKTITVDYAITDGTVSTPAHAVFTITGTNDAPLVSGEVLAAATEDSKAASIDMLANASDVDHGAKLSITAAPPVVAPDEYWGRGAGEAERQGNDTAQAAPSHVSFDLSALPAFVAFDAATKRLTLDPTAAAFQHLGAGETMTVSVNYGVTDGIAAAATLATATFTVTGTNDAPVVSGPAHLTVTEDGPRLTIDNDLMLSVASDADIHDTLSVVDIQSPLPVNMAVVDEAPHVVAVPDPTAYYGIRYDYVAGAHGVQLDTSAAAFQSLAQGETVDVAFTYGVTDGTVTTRAQGVFTVVGANDAPIVSAPLEATVTEDSAGRTLSALAHASDIDHGAVLSVTGAPPSVAIAGTSESSGPYYGALRVRNSNSNSTDDPTANATASATGGGTVYDLSGLPAGVSFDAATNSFSIDPSNVAFQRLSEGQVQTVTVNYGVTDGIAVTAAKAVFTVIGTNDGPVVGASQAFSASEDALAQVVDPLANVTDVDQLDHLSIVPGALPEGVQTVTLPGGYYQPDIVKTVFNPGAAEFQALAQGETKTVTWDYQVTDGHVTVTNTASFTVTGVNDAPVIAVPVGATMSEDAAPVTVDALANATDVDHGAVLSVVGVPAILPAGITYDAATHSFSIDPANAAFQSLAQGEMHTYSVSYGVSDGIATTMTSVNFTVIGVNDAPVVSGPATATPNEDGQVATINAFANVVDADDPQHQGHGLSVKDVSDVLPAGVTYDAANHRFSLDPSNAAYQSLSAGETLDVMVNYTVSDSYVDVATSAIFTVTGRNDVATVTGVVEGGAVSENAAAIDLNLLANAVDVDHLDVLHVKQGQGAAVTASVTGGTWTAPLSFSAANDHLVLDPGQFNALGAGETVDLTFNYAVTDGSKSAGDPLASAHITIVGADDAPVSLSLSSTKAIDQSTAGTVIGQFSTVDADRGDSFTYQLANDPNGLFAISGNQLVVATGVTLDINAVASDTIAVSVTDAAGASLVQNFTISLNAIPGVTIAGTSGNDVYSLTSAVHTTNGADTVNGGKGNDTIDGAGGNDVLVGDVGDDTLLGGAGNDILTGGVGKDTVMGGDGNDRLLVGGSDDTFDTLNGGAGVDTIAVQGNSSLSISGFNALAQSIEVWEGNGKGVSGTSTAEIFDFSGLTSITGSGMGTVDAGAGNDRIVGSKFADDLRGGADNDVINGGLGNDLLAGGNGADTFVFDKGFGKDKITDFSAGTSSSHDFIDMDRTVFADFNAVKAAMAQVGADVVITAGADTVTITGVTVANLVAVDFLFH